MVRDKEIERLIQYAKGMGLKVSFVENFSDTAAWALDGSEILINKKKNKTKIDTVLSLIHELGHHVWFIHEKNRLPDLKFEEAINRQNLFEEDFSETPAPKHLRYKIFKVEENSAKWWDTIYKDTNMKFPYWRLEAARSFDVFQYEYYYETGYFPKRLERNKKKKELKDKYYV